MFTVNCEYPYAPGSIARAAERYDEISKEYDETFQLGYRTEIQNTIVFSALKKLSARKTILEVRTHLVHMGSR